MEVLKVVINSFCFLALLYHLKYIREMLVYGRVFIGTKFKNHHKKSVILSLILLVLLLGEFASLYALDTKSHVILLITLGVAIWDQILSLERFFKFEPKSEGYKFYPIVQPVPEDKEIIYGDVLLREEQDGTLTLVIAAIKNSPELRERMKGKTHVMVWFENDCIDVELLGREKNVKLN